MWNYLAKAILKNRAFFIVLIAIWTIVMTYFATKSELAYDMQKLVPKSDSDMIIYENFKKKYGEDANNLVIGFEHPNLFSFPFYKKFVELNTKIQSFKGVKQVISPAHFPHLQFNDSTQLLNSTFLPYSLPKNKEACQQVEKEFTNIEFYKDKLTSNKGKVTIMLVALKDSTLNSIKRNALITSITNECNLFGKNNNLNMHYSGLPYVRTQMSTTVKQEIVLFTFIAFIVTALFIFVFYKSYSTLLISIIFIIIGVVTMLGMNAILGFKMNLLTGTLPPLLVVIGVQNTIYFINKYHEEFLRTGNKITALEAIISKLGVATFLINFTTAVGFGTFYFTKTSILEEYGILSFLVINIIFVINIIGITCFYSFAKEPTAKETNHLQAPRMNQFLNWVKFFAFNHRRRIFFWSLAASVFGLIYMTKLKPLAYMVDDLPSNSSIVKDLHFFQKHLGGVMPFEILIKCNEEGAAQNAETLVKINSLQRRLNNEFPELSKPLSLAEVVKYANQSYNGGNKDMYRIPNALDLGNLVSALPNSQNGAIPILKGLVDSSYSEARISYSMKDVGSFEMERIVKKSKEIASKIFNDENYEVQITGTSQVFLKGNTYLYDSLLSSTLWALLIISFTMGLLFPSFKMILISVIPNIIPLVITAGLMGFFSIPLKPSTILVFSIAFGITIDATIHFVSVFKSRLLIVGKTLRHALSETIMEVGLSMIYTMVALFAGFFIFCFSDFKGTISLGWLTGVTLLTGLISNLLLLPALILAFEKSLNLKVELKDSLVDDTVEFK